MRNTRLRDMEDLRAFQAVAEASSVTGGAKRLGASKASISRRIAALEAALGARLTTPVIASGGAGRLEHFPPAVRAGADAVLAASVFHFGQLSVGQVKAELASAGLPVR